MKKHMRKASFFLLLIIILETTTTRSQNFYAIDTIQKIEINFTQTNWDYILDTAKQGSDSYTMAQWVKINGVLYDSVGVKYKGNSSYNPGNAKNPLHIELDHFKNQDYMGFKDIKLNNGYHEPTMVREVLSYALLQNYMQASRANFAQVYINGAYFGLYTNVESVTKTFLESRFYSKEYPFFFMDNGGCNLVYKGPDTALYYMPYTMKSDYGWTALKNLCFTLKNNINNIKEVLDVDRALWMIAFTNVTVTLDSYIGQSTHNYYIYEDHKGHFNSIIWDLNGGFGIFNRVGGNVQLTVQQMQNMSPLLHAPDTLWPLVNKLLAVPQYRKIYMAHVRTLVEENFSDTSYYTYAQYLQSIIDTAVQSDTKKFYTYPQFLSGLNTTIIDGPKTIPGLSELMDARTNYLNAHPEIQKIPPAISNIQVSNPSPFLNTSFFITAKISGATQVFLGMRNNVMEAFTAMPMYDDGMHGDGVLGDSIFGIELSMTGTELQYYIYAENNDAGIFSPERAEHDYYTLNADFDIISTGSLVINEILAINDNTVALSNGQYSDWIELYNNTADTLVLNNLYLSDDISNPEKWIFPTGTLIMPHDYVIVWAEDGSISGEFLSGFGFSGSGEQAIISYAGGIVVDSLTFPAQTADISYGRYPNGTGPFVYMTPTFKDANSIAGISDTQYKEPSVSLFPNPTSNIINIINQNTTPETFNLSLINIQGQLLLSKRININTSYTLDLSKFSKGIYFLNLQNEKENFVSKVIKN